ncbi:unnamed protein product, partial [Mesorhabditis belari]|uniref:Uncharacterized protein n=1 Tax=Mesorhabditis belari TaxID=2138241 RepID=A0AAF3FB54_9BILA
MKILVASLLLELAACQVYYTYPRQQQRQQYYPVRTNCHTPCQQQRYRWNYRPQPIQPQGQHIITFPIVITLRPPVIQPPPPGQPIKPPQPIGSTTVPPTPVPELPSPQPVNPNAIVPTKWRPISSPSTLPTPPPESSTVLTTQSTTPTTRSTTTTTTTNNYNYNKIYNNDNDYYN